MVSGFVSPTTFVYAGDIAPLGYFDPLGITDTKSESKVKYLREAELQHGRVAMLSFLTLAGLDLVSPDLAINQLSSLSTIEQTPYWFGVGMFEVARMFNGWTSPTKGLFTLNESYQPGNVLLRSKEAYHEDDLNKELSNGRLAMVGCIGYIAQELITHNKVL
jgi:hypothetical protein